MFFIDRSMLILKFLHRVPVDHGRLIEECIKMRAGPKVSDLTIREKHSDAWMYLNQTDLDAVMGRLETDKAAFTPKKGDRGSPYRDFQAEGALSDTELSVSCTHCPYNA